jgi:hypothetical protein
MGSVETWLMQSLAGIQPHPAARAMNKVIIKPKPSMVHTAELPFFAGSFSTPRGTIRTSWRWVADGKGHVGIGNRGNGTTNVNRSRDSKWKCACPSAHSARFALQVSIPPNIEADLFLPALSSMPSFVCEGGSVNASVLFSDRLAGVMDTTHLIPGGGSRTSVTLGSGEWQFEICD